MQNARQAVRAFARAQKAAFFAIKLRAPLHQLVHAQRPLSHQDLGRFLIHQSIARFQRVFQVQRDVPLAFHRHRNAALRIMRV